METIVQITDESLRNPHTGYRPYVPRQCAVAVYDIEGEADGGAATCIRLTTTDASGKGLVTKHVDFGKQSIASSASGTGPLFNNSVVALLNAGGNSDAVFAADSIGNVISVSIGAAADERQSKRKRPDELSSHILSADSCEPMVGGFSVRGVAGATLLISLSGKSQIAVAREHFRDVRVVDPAAPGKVVRSVYPMHAPVAMCASPDDSTFALAEGPVASIWDLRCPAACVQRITTNDTVTDVSVAGTQLYVASTARSVTAFDTRKWIKASSVQGITKHPISNITVSADGTCCVVAGSDTEAKFVSMNEKIQPVTDPNATHNFRQKFENSVNCDYAWHGRWVHGGGGAVSSALGMSATGELIFLPRLPWTSKA